MPKKFKRPSIDLDRKEPRTWKNVCVRDLKPGDIVSGWGKVQVIKSATIRPFYEVYTGLDGDAVMELHKAQDFTTVFAFTEGD